MYPGYTWKAPGMVPALEKNRCGLFLPRKGAALTRWIAGLQSRSIGKSACKRDV